MAIAGALALALIAGSRPGVVGDGGEYLAQALNFARFEGPSFGLRSAAAIERQVKAIEPTLDHWNMPSAMVVGADGRRDFLHFWFYALLTTPALSMALASGISPLAAFTATNLAFFGLALWVALPRIGAPGSLLLMGGPIIWWIDKPHTEVFTVSLLLIALLLQRERPWWALVAAGMAATQNPPIAVLVPLIGAAALWGRPRLLQDRRFLAGAAVGVLLAVLHPAYTYARYGTPSLLLRATTPGAPSATEALAVVLDPTLGLLGNFPILFCVAALAFVAIARRNWRALIAPEAIVALLSAAVFLYSFGRTANFHHGATPSLSRYALWLVPLIAPALVYLRQHGPLWWRPLLAGAATISAAVCLFAFHPAVPQNSREPTWAAMWLWTRHPGWHDPLPEVFAETLSRQEALVTPIATANCEKILLAIPPDGGDVLWPYPCYPVALGGSCSIPGALCYANRHEHGYDFASAPGRQRGRLTVNPSSWSASEAADVRRLYEAWGWGGEPPRPSELADLRQYVDVSVITLGAAERFLMILQDFGDAPVLRFRFSRPMTGRLVDPGAGATVAVVDAPGDAETMFALDLPPGYPVLVLTMTAADGATP
jgi:hypothetical protein